MPCCKRLLHRRAKKPERRKARFSIFPGLDAACIGAELVGLAVVFPYTCAFIVKFGQQNHRGGISGISQFLQAFCGLGEQFVSLGFVFLQSAVTFVEEHGMDVHGYRFSFGGFGHDGFHVFPCLPGALVAAGRVLADMVFRIGHGGQGHGCGQNERYQFLVHRRPS